MSDKKWTPGPWAATSEDVPPIIYSTVTEKCVALQDSDGAYADCWHEEGYAKANANLIAAAPELYEALEMVLAFLPEPECAIWRDVDHRARQAISKARGES